MKKLSLLLFASAFLFLVSCKTQQTPLQQAIKHVENQVTYQNAVQSIDDMNFVVEANRVFFTNGQSVFVNSNTNFVSVKDGNATIQLAFNGPNAGPNGIGGITLQGTISNVKKQVDKKGNIIFSMSVNGPALSAQVFFNMTAGTNQCSATVSPNFNGRRITFSGTLYPSAESNVFKGQPSL